MSTTNFITVCIELTQNIGYGQTVTYTQDLLANAPKPQGAGGNPTNGMGPDAAAYISELWFNHMDQVIAQTNNPVLYAQYAGAFQLAVWKLVYDQADLATGFDLSLGKLTAVVGTSTTVTYLAQQWLTELLHEGKDSPNKDTLMALVSDNPNGSQDQIVEVGGGTPAPTTVPEPATIAIWSLLSALGVTYGCWRRK